MTRAPWRKNALVTEEPRPPLAPVMKTTLSGMNGDPSRDRLCGWESRKAQRFQAGREIILAAGNAPLGCSMFPVVRGIGKGFRGNTPIAPSPRRYVLPSISPERRSRDG